MEIQFKGKRALVTGAGKGIGRAIAKRLVELGADTVALSRTLANLESLKQEVPSIQTVLCDLGDWKKTREVLADIGDIDLLVNNAGVGKCNNFLDVTEEELDWTMNVNFKALFNVSQVITRRMVDRGVGGSVVNMSSIASTVGMVKHAVYAATKAAVDQLTRIMALELGQHKIRVNSVNPTVVMTDLSLEYWSNPVNAEPLLSRIPMGKFLEMSDIVDCVMYLLSDQAAMIHGVVLSIDGGQSTS